MALLSASLNQHRFAILFVFIGKRCQGRYLMKHDMKIKKQILRRVILLLICWSTACLLPACGISQETGFPDLVTTQSGSNEPSQTSETTPSGTETGRSLTVALPFGSDCLESVRLLFFAKESGPAQSGAWSIYWTANCSRGSAAI